MDRQSSTDGSAILFRREMRLHAKRVLRGCLSRAGHFLPVGVKRQLGMRSSKLGYLLFDDGDFTFERYLGDISIQVNVRSDVERAVLAGRYEKDVLAVVDEIVRPGFVCVDIGANVGAVALALCRAVGKTGRVHCFEPGPPFIRRLADNLALNPALEPIAELHQLGVSDETGELLWREDPEFVGSACLFGAEGTRVPVTTLDGWAEDREIARLDFIKIDVEGMELEVLRGARGLLERFHPAILFESSLEFEALRGMPLRRMTQDYLRELGYTLYGLRTDGTRAPVSYPAFPQNSLALADGFASQKGDVYLA